jgi:DNA recombination protein RmuC
MLSNLLLALVLVVATAVLVLQVLALRRKIVVDLAPLQDALRHVEDSYHRTEQLVRQEIAENRRELGETLNTRLDQFSGRLDNLTQRSEQKLEQMRSTTEQKLVLSHEESGRRLDLLRSDSAGFAQKLREEVGNLLKTFGDSTVTTLRELGAGQRLQLVNVIDELRKLTEATERRLDGVRLTVEQKLTKLQEDNAKQLDLMRQTVDEKLQGTLEKRLGESFKHVSERLQAVYEGLGEMRTLATGVGDLKKVLTNVKTRGTWGEVQLAALLEQVLNPDQYATNVATREGGERVEFAIRLPGRTEREEAVWLPIDAKFPIEDYQRLLDAQEAGDPEAAEQAGRQLEARIKDCAGDICEKYLNPPKTTDFGILFLPIEGLFAEVIRRIGLAEYVQRECRVVIAGPTTLWSILNSLQMGFRTLAIEKRSSEVWNLLAAVKTEWGKYGEVLAKVQRKLREASNTIDAAEVRTRAIGRKLRTVQELPSQEAQTLLMLDTPVDGVESDGDDGSDGTIRIAEGQ